MTSCPISSVQDGEAATSNTMPPKKPQNKVQKTSKRCNFNNRGYCKSEKECSNKHSDVVCDTLECEEETCDKRHPYECKYGRYCRFNKKKECLYSHVTLANEDHKLDALNKDIKNKVCKLENSIVNMQKELIGRDSIINDLKMKMNAIEGICGSLKMI